MPKVKAEATKAIEVTYAPPRPEVIALILLQITIGVGLTVPVEGR